MRTIVISSLLAIVALWLAFGPQVSALCDRLHTSPDSLPSLGNYGIGPRNFRIGTYGWVLSTDVRPDLDSNRRVVLILRNSTFTLGPATTRYASTPPEFDFIPDPNDHVSFVKTHSSLPWPTPFNFSIMGGVTPTWKRHSYATLKWTKSSGAQLQMTWTDEQSYFAKSGWTDGNIPNPATILITPSPFETAAIQYLTSQKNWTRNQYRLEDTGPSVDGKFAYFTAIFLEDLNPTHPGAGQSVLLQIDRSSGQVVRESGMQ